MENRQIETGIELGDTSCVPQSKGDGFIDFFFSRRTRVSIEAQIKLTKKLLDVVNSEEEYEFLKRELAELEGLVPHHSSSSLKGGAALTCR